MNVIAHGVDLVHCPRIERIWQRHGDAFLERIFTAGERAYCLDAKFPVLRLSGRFAIKEAVLKALGTGWRGGIEWTDIETLPDPLGRPLVTLRGQTLELCNAQGIVQMLASISHAGEYAVGSVIAVGLVIAVRTPP